MFVENNTSVLLALTIFILTLFVRFEAIDCIASPCLQQTHERSIDLISLGQQALLYCGVLALLLLPIFRDRGGLWAGIGICVRMALGAVFGYYFPLLVMLGTQLFDIRFIYPYLILSSLLGILIFLSTEIHTAVKIILVIAFSLFFIPGANVVNADVYKYAFEGKTDLSHSGGYYAFLYSQIWMYLTRFLVFVTAYIVIDTERLGRTYVLLRQIGQAITPYPSRHRVHPESVIVQDYRTRVLPSSSVVTDGKNVVHRTSQVAATELSQGPEIRNGIADLAETECSPLVDWPSLPCPLSFIKKGQVTGDYVAFGGYAFHPLQFRVLQLLPQNIPAKKLETDYYFLFLKNQYYPNRNITSSVILMDVYSGMRQHQVHILSVIEGESFIPAKTRTARKLLIAWLVKMGVTYTENYKFLDSERI